MSQSLFGTNCGNCRFFTGRVCDGEEINRQGGIVILTGQDLDNAKRADLITLPEKQHATKARLCTHPKVAQPVNDRMCCAYWDNIGALRQWKTDAKK